MMQKLTTRFWLAITVAAVLALTVFCANQIIVFDMVRDLPGLQDKLESYKNLQFFFLSLMLFVLALTVHFIFRPTMKYISHQVEKAEEGNRLKSEFVATISHEIRSPMTGVLGMAELLLASDQSEDQKNYTRTIIDSGETLLNIIEDVLDLSKIEANKIELHSQRVNLQDLLDELCALHYSRAREKALEVVVHYTPGCENFFIADPVRLKQIFGNLINNAIKFTEKGHVLITVSECESNNKDVSNIVVSVKDTGIGIHADKHEKVFELFRQADSSTTRNYGGTGLGLTICKRLVDLMGGNILLDSAVGEGAEFKVILPLKKSARDNDLSKDLSVLVGVKTLIVDDLGVMRTLLEEQFSLAGMKCTSAKSGEEALAFLTEAAIEDAPYDLVLIDYIMGGMNGEELAEKIKTDNNLKDTCLVMLTSTGNPLDERKFYERGFSAHLTKPFRNDELLNNLAVIWSDYNNGEKDHVSGKQGKKDHSHDKNILSGFYILIVEDSRLNQAFVKEVLERLGAQVVTADNGKAAMEIEKESGPFDLILMDCQMPVLDGFETTRIIRIKEQETDRETPIIAMTANAMKGDKEKCLEAGMNDYLSKPMRAKSLVDMVLKHVDIADQEYNRSDNVVALKRPENPKSLHVIDKRILKEIKQTFGDQYYEVYAIFAEDTPEYIRQIAKAFEDGHTQQAILPAHTIKSTSMRMGAVKLSMAAKEIEEFCLNGKKLPPIDLEIRLKDLEEKFQEARKYLERM